MAGSPVNTQIAGTGIATAGTVAAPFLVSAAMVPVVGAIAALVALAVTKLFSFGPDPNNVPASQIEETFEYASDLINLGLFQGNYIDKSTAIAYLNAMATALNSSELQAPQAVKDSKPFKNGVTDGTMHINKTIARINSMPDSPLVAWNATAANARLQALMSGSISSASENAAEGIPYGAGDLQMIGPHHWYPVSAQQGLSIVQGIIAQIEKQNTYNVGGLSVSKKTADYGLLAAGALVLWEVI